MGLKTLFFILAYLSQDTLGKYTEGVPVKLLNVESFAKRFPTADSQYRVALTDGVVSTLKKIRVGWVKKAVKETGLQYSNCKFGFVRCTLIQAIFTLLCKETERKFPDMNGLKKYTKKVREEEESA